jgi:hypothetical protein
VTLARDLLMIGRLAAELPAFLRKRITLDGARARIRQRLERREENFLDLVERGVYGHPGSPYLPLLRAARCELGDLRSMVRSRGLEATLEALREAGVYITFDEAKGRAPIERDGVHLQVGADAFRNPLIRGHYTRRSTGSTGAPVEIPHDLGHLLVTTQYRMVSCEAHDLLGAPLGLWRCAPPLGTGLDQILRSILMGNVARRWFAPMGSESVRLDRRFRLATEIVLRECQLLGHRVPFPEPVSFSEAIVIARWAAETVAAEGRCLIRTGVSMAMRMAAAAVDGGIGLNGVTVMAGGEPPTPAKVRRIRESGAKYVPHYAGSDMGLIGLGCADPANESDVHFLEDRTAVLVVPQRVPTLNREVGAFCFTSLEPTSGRLLLNVELDDFGTLESRSCSCPFGELGFERHMWGIRSYRKLTGEGINLTDGVIVRVLEEVLPDRFGGDPHDYQIHEREDPDGYTRLVLVVDPRIDLPDDAEVVTVILESLARGDVYADSAREHWEQANTFRIERRAPTWVGRGKFPPLVVHRV